MVLEDVTVDVALDMALLPQLVMVTTSDVEKHGELLLTYELEHWIRELRGDCGVLLVWSVIGVEELTGVDKLSLGG